LFSSDGIKSVGRRHQKPITKVAPSLLWSTVVKVPWFGVAWAWLEWGN
jgi:hypothetical protein